MNKIQKNISIENQTIKSNKCSKIKKIILIIFMVLMVANLILTILPLNNKKQNNKITEKEEIEEKNEINNSITLPIVEKIEYYEFGFSGKEAIEYEINNFGKSWINIEGKDGLIPNSLYYSNHDFEGNILSNEKYSMYEYMKYVKWLDKKIYKDEEFRREYTENLINKDSWAYMNTGNLEKSSYDNVKKTNLFEYNIEKIEKIDTDIRIYVKLTKSPNFNLYLLQKNEQFLSLMKEIVSKCTDIPFVKIGTATLIGEKYELSLINQVNEFAFLSGNFTEFNSEFTIRFFRINENGNFNFVND